MQEIKDDPLSVVDDLQRAEQGERNAARAVLRDCVLIILLAALLMAGGWYWLDYRELI